MHGECTVSLCNVMLTPGDVVVPARMHHAHVRVERVSILQYEVSFWTRPDSLNLVNVFDSGGYSTAVGTSLPSNQKTGKL